MHLAATLLLETDATTAVPCILMLHPQSGDGQIIEVNELKTSVPCPRREYVDVYGNLCLRTIIPAGPFRLESRIIASCADEIAVDPSAGFTPMEEIPDQVLQFLLPSRYCEADQLGNKAWEIVAAAAPGYAQVEAIRQWIHDHFEYAYGTTNSSTSAADVIASGKGVCRDYAHAGIALCRSLDIPARMVVGYLYDLNPMDLHAWWQAYIGGQWFTFDATQTAPRGNRIVIAYGKDAADVAIATYFANMMQMQIRVNVQAVNDRTK
jgi:transglutaminase-like putative cysteine protease